MTCEDALELLESSPDVAREHCASCARCQEVLQRADKALELLRETPGSSVPPAFSSALLDAARAGVRAHRWRQRARQAVRPLVAVTVTALVVIAAERMVHSSAIHRLAAPGDVLVASAAAVTEGTTAGGASIWMERPGELRLMEAGPAERVRIEAGSARFEVRKLAPGASFAVETAHARVVVHGTRFTVSTGRDTTRITVSEGRVQVQPLGAERAPEVLTAGDSLEVPSAERFLQGLWLRAEELLARGEWDEALHTLDRVLGSKLPVELEGQARARRALVLSARGEGGAALEEYERALKLIPEEQAPLWADNAAAERAILLERSGRPAAAAAAWHEYQRRFPNGVHSALARDRGAGPPR
ncbi:FecR domain-containing protein [Hyalangium versicolor]|uniref:FecR domain-containing protein n=1 Tax=Hyalangium versicolor TaxID=2861190 RepID=UPI001CCD5088|nr:FecR domain-containing protein [Hyalangium versicolor]